MLSSFPFQRLVRFPTSTNFLPPGEGTNILRRTTLTLPPKNHWWEPYSRTKNYELKVTATRKLTGGRPFRRSGGAACSVSLFPSLFLEHSHDASMFLQILVMGCDVTDIAVIPFDCFIWMLLSGDCQCLLDRAPLIQGFNHCTSGMPPCAVRDGNGCLQGSPEKKNSRIRPTPRSPFVHSWGGIPVQE